MTAANLQFPFESCNALQYPARRNFLTSDVSKNGARLAIEPVATLRTISLESSCILEICLSKSPLIMLAFNFGVMVTTAFKVSSRTSAFESENPAA